MLEECLGREFKTLVLTNAMRLAAGGRAGPS
jgi:hypothetical protein